MHEQASASNQDAKVAMIPSRALYNHMKWSTMDLVTIMYILKKQSITNMIFITFNSSLWARTNGSNGSMLLSLTLEVFASFWISFATCKRESTQKKCLKQTHNKVLN